MSSYINYKFYDFISIIRMNKNYSKKCKNSYLSIKYEYNCNNNDKLLLLGEEFLKKNKRNIIYIYNHKKNKLKEEIKIENKINTYIKIQMIFLNNFNSVNSMFKNCNSLISIKGELFLKINELDGVEDFFYNCTSLESLNCVFNFNFNSKKSISFNRIFYNCSSLLNLPDISK